MKISVLTENLQKKLSFAGHAISNRNQLPILACFLLEAKEGRLIIKATDLEIGIEISVQVNVEKEGSVAVPAKLFTDLVNALPAEKISIESKDGSVFVEGKKTKSVLQTINKDEFPMLYEDKGEEILQIKPVEFGKDLTMVVFASSIESSRPALSGILMKKESDGFVFVATDGYRLSLKKDTKQLDKKEEEKPLIVPARIIREALSLKEDGQISIFVSGNHNQVIFSQNDTLLIGRLIEAEFPNYQKIIPTDMSAKVTFDREELLKAVKTCSVFARDSANIITLALSKGKITVSAKTPSLGENTVEVEATLIGEENEIAFNARYLLDVLGSITSDSMYFEMTGPLNPGVFRIADDPNFLHLIMPIRT